MIPGLTEVKQTVCVPSRRFYLDELNPADAEALLLSAERFNRIKEHCYNAAYDCRYRGGPDVSVAKEAAAFCLAKYGAPLSAYWQASVYSAVTGLLSSQRELLKLQRADAEARIGRIAEKIEGTEETLRRVREWKEWCVAFSRYKSGRRDSAPACPAGVSEKDGTVSLRPGRKENAYTFYGFECMTDRTLKALKARLSLLREKKRAAEEKLSRMSVPPRITFGGGKRFYRLKDTVPGTDMGEWHRERDAARNRSFLLGGRHTSKYGNFICRYDVKKEEIAADMIDGRTVVFKDVSFPYRGDELKEHVSGRKGSVGYSVEFRTDGHGRTYVVLKASFTETKRFLNTSCDDGVVAFDTNYGRLDWVDLSADGNLLDHGTVFFDTSGTSQEMRISRLTAVAEVALVAKDRKKPLVHEDLDFRSRKNAAAYGNRKRNGMLGSFAYSQILEGADRKAFRFDTGVITVNPAYTSLIGRAKYMRPLGIPSHTAAAVVIGRRALGLDEKPPGYLSDITSKGKKPVPRATQWKRAAGHLPASESRKLYGELPRFRYWKHFDRVFQEGKA